MSTVTCIRCLIPAHSEKKCQDSSPPRRRPPSQRQAMIFIMVSCLTERSTASEVKGLLGGVGRFFSEIWEEVCERILILLQDDYIM